MRQRRLRMVGVPAAADGCALFHDLAVRRTPGQMLSAVDRKRDPGDISRLGKINHGGCNVVRLRPPLKRQALGLGGNCMSVWRALGRVGPGATALTRTRGANACASVIVAVCRAALLKV